MDYYPNNTAGRFTTKLNSLIELEGDWEVGLTEIISVVRRKCGGRSLLL